MHSNFRQFSNLPRFLLSAGSSESSMPLCLFLQSVWRSVEFSRPYYGSLISNFVPFNYWHLNLELKEVQFSLLISLLKLSLLVIMQIYSRLHAESSQFFLQHGHRFSGLPEPWKNCRFTWRVQGRYEQSQRRRLQFHCPYQGSGSVLWISASHFFCLLWVYLQSPEVVTF